LSSSEIKEDFIWLNHNLGANFFLTNSLLVAMTNTGTHTGLANTFTTDLSAQLKKKTTYPPLIYSNLTLAVETTFSPQAQRDFDVPDRGFHYDALDYAFGGLNAGTNVVFTAGTAIGWFELPGSSGPGYGLSLPNDVTAMFTGTATLPCVFARYSTVQEGVNGHWKDKGWLAGIRSTGTMITNRPSRVVAQFLHSYLPAGGPCHFRDYNNMLRVTANHSEFYVGNLGGYNTQSSYTNCLFDRIYLVNNTSVSTAWFILRNTTHYGGWIDFGHSESGPPYWFSSIVDCAFDGTAITMGNPSGGNPLYVFNDFNAYLVGSNNTIPAGPNDINVGSFGWMSGWSRPGRFFLPWTTSPLVDGGSTTADQRGLFHFTTSPSDGMKEEDSQVDIGYHYVAVDWPDIPMDEDQDGTPDYIEDANGNGILDSGEARWDDASDSGLRVWITRPTSGSIVP